MAQIIPNGGTRESQDQLVGAPDELTVDRSNRELRLHDGSTPGGFRIPNLDTIEEEFQARSDELDGLKSFAPAARGLLVRLRAGAYAIRKFVTEGGLDVENADGYAGDFVTRLGGTVTQDMTFEGDVLIKKVLQVDGGVSADTSGNHIGGLDARGAEVFFDDKSIPASAIDSPAATSPFAIGMILMWAGDPTELPTGWALCNGNDGTPNLAERFVIGISDEVKSGQTGGRVEHSHQALIGEGGEHRHRIVVHDFKLEQIHMPEHQHGPGVCDQDGSAPFNHGMIGANPQAPETINATSAQPGRFESLTTKEGGGQPHSHGGEADPDGIHTHPVNMEVASHIPPYYALAYIMRIS